MEPEEILTMGCDMLGLAWKPQHKKKLLFFARELERFNRRLNLVKAEGRELIVKHLLDSLAGLPVFLEYTPAGTVLDIGSGAGFPAIPLALFLEDRAFTLCEKIGKKVVFLENIVLLLGLKHARVVQADYARLTEQFDTITFRAFSRIATEIDNLLQRLKPGGYILAYKGTKEKTEEEQEELAGLKLNLQIMVKKMAVPFLGEERHMLIIKKAQA